MLFFSSSDCRDGFLIEFHHNLEQQSRGDRRRGHPQPRVSPRRSWEHLHRLECPGPNSPALRHHPPDPKPGLRRRVPHAADALLRGLFGSAKLDFQSGAVQSAVLPLLHQHVRFHISDHADESAQAGGDSVAETRGCGDGPPGDHPGHGGTLGSRSGTLSARFGFQDHNKFFRK